ncbi:transcription termination/antitermination NusG family protein [Pseudomonas gingeri]|uniref:transcription termination/antitermination NusG family protein n=1 Tax=Pseudomonas gingeri TaxID=117681 RepID=UPI00210B25D5|nr:transcription termination/antitermination NusG family protein [Pseudomonas gingeri]
MDIGSESLEDLPTSVSQEPAVSWYLVQCKPRQDGRAEEHLQPQGYHCYRSQLCVERVGRGRRQSLMESLFPGYLFIALGADANWAPLRSTRGVSRLVGFNDGPRPVAGSLIEDLQQRTACEASLLPRGGEKGFLSQHYFFELEAIFENNKGDERVVRLLTLLDRRGGLSFRWAVFARSNLIPSKERVEALT